MDEELALAAVKNGAYLYYLDEKYKTYNICLEAVKARPYNFGFVPSDFKTDEFRALTGK